MSARGTLTLGALLASIAVPAAAAPAVAAPRAALVGEGTLARAVVCGVSRPVLQVASGTTVHGLVAPARGRSARATRRGSALVVERCADARWVRVRSVRLGVRRGSSTVALPSTDADLRVRVVDRRGRAGQAAYARIGVGEIVDVPVTFSVVNQNRTLIPCLGAPDGATYPVHGSLVAPRSALQAAAPAVTLYLHGLGYAGWFFRFQDVPGYDYGLQQAREGHASVVLDRLGNPAHDDLPDGAGTCIPSQADIADQIIGKLRKGEYEAPAGATQAFKKVGLAGHSAGGFIAQVTQYSFASADALAVVGYTDLPSSLALSTFLTAGGDCRLAPERSHGATGAPNYAPFGRTDEDFRAGHFHDVDPAVAAAVLARRNRDPCGDLLNAAQPLVLDQLGTRTIAAPVLVISGSDDALFMPPTNQVQAGIGYLSSSDVTLVELPDTGHAVTLGLTHEQFRSEMHRWLSSQGL
jgi:pimeloyl-ACP methyl ester carboxylesterase